MRIVDLTGKRFDRLRVITRAKDKRGDHSVWVCKCRCGNIVEVQGRALTGGHAKSCGCLRKENAQKNRKTKMDYVDGTLISHISSKKMPNTNTSGVKGVHWSKQIKKWRADIQFKGKKYYLGSFDKIEEAAKARKEAEERIFGPFLEWYNQYKKEKE